MRRVVKRLMVVVTSLCLLIMLAYGAYLQRDQIAVWLGLSEAKPELSATPLFKPLERFVISLEGEREPRYLVLELNLVTRDPTQLTELDELTPLIRNVMVQYFSNRKHEDVQKELQDITALQTSLFGQLRATMQGYGYKSSLDEVLITKILVQ
ncbi:flagellar basal body-associated FliL family protein [Aeromonas enteropelogenes]|uniref:flagellar basal body-associated FliL family protein n=1 Tax=Aeromonas enteropelogenes TaxID=29489 RepID=UPI003BA195A0